MSLLNIAEAHEVYVLTPAEVATAQAEQALPFGPVVASHAKEFAGWGLLIAGLMLLTFAISLSRWWQTKITAKIDRWQGRASRITEVTVGLALIASAVYDAAFGPEISLKIFGDSNLLTQILFMLSGATLVLGRWAKLGALLGLGLYVAVGVQRGWYVLMYGVYFGDLLVSLFPNAWQKYKFVILRVLFGFSLIFASIYAKFWFNQLALETIAKFSLTNYFPFSPEFLLLGAFCVEILIGVAYILGFQVRLTSIVFTVFLVQSVLFFKEAVWPHVILFGTAVAMLAHGDGEYSLGGYLKRRLRKI